nr:hypothetical protein Iba_chr04aCG19910 [Ipomoea batatas]
MTLESLITKVCMRDMANSVAGSAHQHRLWSTVALKYYFHDAQRLVLNLVAVQRDLAPARSQPSKLQGSFAQSQPHKPGTDHYYLVKEKDQQAKYLSFVPIDFAEKQIRLRTSYVPHKLAVENGINGQIQNVQRIFLQVPVQCIEQYPNDLHGDEIFVRCDCSIVATQSNVPETDPEP